LATKTEFLNNISHEVRTPIQGFTTLSEGLVEHWNSFDESKKLSLAKNVASNAQRLASLVTNLLDLSKFTANKMILDLQTINLGALIEEIIDECNHLYIHNKKIKIQFIIPEAPISLRIDKERISQVLRNLFANAIKFSPDDSIIIASIMLFNNQLHFSIVDEGIGIPEKELKNIFDPFTQSSRTRTKAGGTGLGLSICQKIIEAHSGKIWALNNADKGASFHFSIPADNPLKKIEIIKKVAAKILMIDDEESCLISMEILLTNSPYILVKANDCKFGLSYLEENNDIDIILLDLMMPGENGLIFLTMIKENPKFANIPVILQTGSSDEELIKTAFNLGAIACIKKPYSKQSTFDALDLALS
jgi:two-component system sensor histidine kinase ChiS